MNSSYLLIPTDFLVQLLIETLLAVFTVAWCLARLSTGRWAVLGAVGGVLYALVTAGYLYAYASARWADTGVALRWLLDHDSRLGWARITGLVLFVGAVTVGRPARAEPATVAVDS